MNHVRELASHAFLRERRDPLDVLVGVFEEDVVGFGEGEVGPGGGVDCWVVFDNL
jgi:hypothetical protein